MSALLNLRALAAALGGDVTGGQVLAPGPGHSASDRSMAVRLSPDARDGFTVHSHAGDDWRLCRDYVSERLGHRMGWRREMPPAPAARGRLDHRWRELWDESRNPRGTLVEKYLANRGLELPADIAGEVLRFHPACPFGPDQRHPCMVALYRNIVTDEPVAIHRTALTADGRKIDRKMFGPVAGSAIKLDADDAVTMGLVIGEGIETCLAARQIGFRPVWALGSAGAIAGFPVLSGIEALSLLEERDEANRRATEACAARWFDEGHEVILVAPKTGKDINDALRGTP
jgi:hypothetical protein